MPVFDPRWFLSALSNSSEIEKEGHQMANPVVRSGSGLNPSMSRAYRVIIVLIIKLSAAIEGFVFLRLMLAHKRKLKRV